MQLPTLLDVSTRASRDGSFSAWFALCARYFEEHYGQDLPTWLAQDAGNPSQLVPSAPAQLDHLGLTFFRQQATQDDVELLSAAANVAGFTDHHRVFPHALLASQMRSFLPSLAADVHVFKASTPGTARVPNHAEALLVRDLSPERLNPTALRNVSGPLIHVAFRVQSAESHRLWTIHLRTQNFHTLQRSPVEDLDEHLCSSYFDGTHHDLPLRIELCYTPPERR